MTDVTEMATPAAVRAHALATRPRHSFNDIPERRDRLDTMLRLVHARLAELGSADAWGQYVSGLARFPQLSPANVLLVLEQHPDATWLSTHRGWGSLERTPIERGIAVLIPTIRHRRVDGRTVWDGGRPVVDEVRHRPATVFDYSSTAGAHIPPLWDEPTRDPQDGFVDDLRAAAAAVGYAVEARRDEAPAGRRVIALIHGHSERQRALKLAHELGEAAGARDGAALFAYALCTANGMDVTAPAQPADPVPIVTAASSALRRILQRTGFRNMR